jgi:hypothetical protein
MVKTIEEKQVNNDDELILNKLEWKIYEKWGIKESFEKFLTSNEDIAFEDWCESEIEYILSKCEFVEGGSKSEYSETLVDLFDKVLDNYFDAHDKY